MRWYQLALNAKAVTAMFNNLPALEEICLCFMELDREGMRLRLRFDLDQFPDRPPSKWARERYNVAQLSVDFLDIKNLCIEGWGRENRSRLNATDANGHIAILIQGGECILRFVCSAFRVANVSGYWNGDE